MGQGLHTRSLPLDPSALCEKVDLRNRSVARLESLIRLPHLLEQFSEIRVHELSMLFIAIDNFLLGLERRPPIREVAPNPADGTPAERKRPEKFARINSNSLPSVQNGL